MRGAQLQFVLARKGADFVPRRSKSIKKTTERLKPVLSGLSQHPELNRLAIYRRCIKIYLCPSVVVLGLPCSMPIIMDVFQMVAGQGGSIGSQSPLAAWLMVSLWV